MPDADYDVIVVGAGTAGMPLAITAAERGASVLVVEKSGQVGGTLYLSGGHVAAGGTRLQQRLGIEDSPDLHYADIMRLSHGLADPALTRLFVDAAPSAMDWLEDLGLKAKPGDPVRGQDHSDFSVPRYYQGAEFGVSILKAMRPAWDAAVARGAIRLLPWTRARDLVRSDAGEVTGVVCEDADGTARTVHGHAVVLTAGGYCGDPDRFLALSGAPNYGRRNWHHNVGDGLDLAVGAGGMIGGGERQLWYPIIVEERRYPSPAWGALAIDPRVRQPWEIQINAAGERFMREDHPDIDLREHAFAAQPGLRCWTVFDQEILDRAPELIRLRTAAEFVRAFDTHPMLARAATLAELAGRMRLPAERLEATVAAYNEGVATGEDAFGRQHLPLPIARPPFYIVELSGSTVVSAAGILVDEALRVKHRDGGVVPNLYAAGETIGTSPVMGDVLVSGGMVTAAIAFGRVLGQRLAEQAGNRIAA